MADNVIDVRLQSAYKTATEWTTANPVLGLGEVGYEIDSGGLFKIGNGTSTWNQLPYSNHRPLTNNDFDTANITDANVGNLIVTGAARFLNTIQGTASSASNAAKVAGTLTITQAGSTKLNGWNGSAATSITLTDNNDTYKFATSTSGATGAIIGLKANGASTFDTNSTVNLATTSIAYPIINALATGSTQATTADYLIGSYAGASSPTTSWWRKQAKLITVGKAEKLGTNAGGVATPVYFSDGIPKVVNGTSAANWLVNSLTAATGVMTTAANLVTQQASGATTVYYQRPNAKLPQYATASISDHTLTLKNGSGEVVTNLTLPNDNTDTKVTQTATTAKTYLIGNAGSATTTSGANLSTAVYMNNGNLVVGGSITIGGNNADTSGAKWQYNSTLESVSLVFA